MRKILLTVMMVSSLLAFNACTKDGAQGPAGPAGAAGTAGPAGAVGAAGAKGADGTKVLSGTAAPAASAGANGDFFFDKTAKVLYGPKADGAWPAGVTLSGEAGAAGKDGANGKDGADGKDGVAGAAGASFVAGIGTGADGKGAPAESVGKPGDFFFNTANSTFYGPKAKDNTWVAVNVLPLGNTGAKVYYYNVVMSNVNEVPNSKSFGQDIVNTFPTYGIITTYQVTPEDMIRIEKYPGWGDNREMAFETVPGNGVFTNIPADGAALNALPLGTRFVFTQDKSATPAIFNLSAADKVKFGSTDPDAFDYMINAKADPATIALGKTLNFANVKNIGLKASTTKYTVNYTAKVEFDLDKIVPNFEKNIQDGGVVAVRTKGYNPVTGALDANWNTTLLNNYRAQYTIGNVEFGPGLKTTEALGVANDVLGLGANIAQIGDNTKVGTQTANFVRQTIKQGNFVYEYQITSGDANTTTSNLNPINGSSYYSTIGGHLTANPGSILNLATGALTIPQNDNGQVSSFFEGRKLRLISVTVLDAATVADAKKAGVNLNDANALEQFVSKR